MSAIGAFPLVQAAARRNRETAGDDMRLLEQRLSGLGRRLCWLGWICTGQLLLMLVLHLIVYFPRIFQNGSLP
jgi:hypothetical protein